MSITSLGRALAAAATGVLGLGLALPGTANAAEEPVMPANGLVTLGSAGALQASGAAAMVRVTVVCPVDISTFLEVMVTQVVDTAIVQGVTYHEISHCTGSPQDITLAVSPNTRPFTKGEAFGHASLSYLSDSQHSGTDEHNVQLS